MPPADRALRELEAARVELTEGGLPGKALLSDTIARLTSVLEVWTRAEELGWPAVTGGRSFFIRGGPADWQGFLDNAGSEDRERAGRELAHLQQQRACR